MSRYFDALDPAELARNYPVTESVGTLRALSRAKLRALQEARFLRIVDRGWEIPFYRRRWTEAGLSPGDIRGLDDLARLPTYDKSDIMASVEANPPFGDFHGREPGQPMILQTTSGTTGRPQPLLWGPKSREVQNMLLARLYSMQGMGPDDIVHSVYGFGMVNGGHYIREAVHHWVGATLLSAGTGAETRSVQQVHLMRDFGATVLVGFGDYIRRLADVAREAGLEPGRDIPVRMISGHFGSDNRDMISEAWGGAQVYDWYGVGDTGAISAEGPDRSGMHIFEDAHLIEVLEPETQRPVEDGAPGEIVCTCLYKDDIFPIIRFVTHDMTQIVPGSNPLGLPFRRMQGMLGRSDNMIKLRGINVYPHGIGALLTGAFAEASGEYICRLGRQGDDMTLSVSVEVAQPSVALGEAMEALLRERLGVRIGVETVVTGSTAALTQIEARQKPIRLIDETD